MSSESDAGEMVQKLMDMMTLESVGSDRFVGQHESIGTPNLYGGHVLAQALMAASHTVSSDRSAHSLHGYFLLPGEHIDLEYQVERIRDGRSFSTRRIVAIQRGREIFEAMASFHVPEYGVAHQFDMLDVQGPEGLERESVQIQRMKDRLPPRYQAPNVAPIGIEYRRVQPYDFLDPKPYTGINSIWMRAVGSLPDDPAMHRAVLAYASDHGLLMTPMMQHGLSFVLGQVVPASLDHAMWFHRDFRVDDWILYQTDSPSAHGARAFCRGNFFTRDGQLIASVAQEGMMRIPPSGARAPAAGGA